MLQYEKQTWLINSKYDVALIKVQVTMLQVFDMKSMMRNMFRCLKFLNCLQWYMYVTLGRFLTRFYIVENCPRQSYHDF